MGRKIGLTLIIIVLGLFFQSWSVAESAIDKKPTKAVPAAPRQITIKEFYTAPAIFARGAKTLDPMDVVRTAWKGYLTNMCEPWGIMPGWQPMLRFYFDDRALPWPQLKPNPVDGLDVNVRNVGAHALLHAMLGAEKENDPAEAGQIAYLLSLTPTELMERKLLTERGRRLYKIRGKTVEPVFGQIKDVRGFDKFMRRGFEACQSEWSLICATHNLLKLWRSGKACWN